MKHNFLRRLGALLLALALTLPMAVTSAWAAPASGFSVTLEAHNRNNQTISLADLGNLGSSSALASATLTANPVSAPSGATTTYRWTSDTPGVVSIAPTSGSRVTITPVELGTATITVTATATWRDGSTNRTSTATAQCPVTVTSIPLVSLSPKDQPQPMKTGETQQLEVLFNPSNASDQTVSWSVYPTDIVMLAGSGATARVTALKEGTARVTARGSNGSSITFTVTVADAATPEVTVTPAQEDIPSLTIGETYKLNASVTASPAPSIVWESRPNNVATVTQDGLVTCLRAGTATITLTVTGANGKKATVTRRITVMDPKNLNANSLSVRGSASVALSAGEQMQLAVNVSPASAQVTWISDNLSVVTVNPTTGNITAIAPGKAKVTATAYRADGTPLTAEFQVEVMAKPTGISFNYPAQGLIYDSNNDGRLTAQFDYSGATTRTYYTTITSAGGGATNTYVVFTSSDTAIATAAARGATGVDLAIPGTRPAGRSTITATVYDNTTKKPVLMEDGRTPMTAELDVVISGIALSESALTMYEGESKPLSISGMFGESYSNSGYSGINWTSSDPSIVSAEGSGGGATLNAWTKGSATITVTKGNYSAKCVVTVVEDPGTVVNAGTAAAGNSIKLGTSSVISQINAIARQKGAGTMDYISSIFISPNQGVVYNSYTSEADTGSGVSMSERYYVNRSTPASEYIGALSFVPNKSFSGEARIAYIGYSSGQAISGVISVNVRGMGDAGADVAYTATAAPVTFQAEDFNIICNNKMGRSLKYVTFTLPDASAGTLYENYINDGHPGQKVLSSTQYNRNGSPNLSNVTFVPADGYSGTVRITYRAVDSANSAYTGTVTITVNRAAATSDPGDISYTAPQDGWVTFQAADFANASQRIIGEPLSHVRFALPSSTDGTLFYNYRGFGDYDSDVDSTTSYYQSGTPALSSVTFVPAGTSEGRTAIHYTGYSSRGSTFTGTVYVTKSNSTYQPETDVHFDYTVKSGSSVNLSASIFNTACRAATGADLDYISFSSLPDAKQGTLRFQNNIGERFNSASTSNQFYRVGTNTSTPLIGNVSFLAGSGFTGMVNIPYVGWNTAGKSYKGEITIQVTPNTIVYTGTTTNPISLSSAHIAEAVQETFTRPLSYIEFTSLPITPAGHVYLNYSGYGTGTRANTGVRYSVSGSSRIDRLSFVPVGRFTGDATASYTAYSTSGETMSGQIIFRISAPAGSSYFTDLRGYSWAAASVDYLYQSDVTNGMSASTYGPSLQIRRSDFILMLHRIYSFTGGSAANPGFADVPANSYYAQAVSAAKQMGIVSGDGSNFMPNSPVTRQDAMVMVYNAMRATGRLQTTAPTTVLSGFPDGTSVSSYARYAVSTLVQMGAVNGSNGMLNPHSPITRAEAAVILHFVMTA